VDRTNEKKPAFFLRNHAGCGYHPRSSKAARHRKPLPNTEQIGRAIRTPKGNYLPMAYGAIGRAWHPRPKYAGTYNKKWLDEVFPFLPANFDDRYYQSAPLDQQIDHLRGGEDVVLLNLTPEGHTSFKVPTVSVPVTFYLTNGEEKESVAVNDTIIIEPDLNRFILVWRVSLPLKKNMFEVAQGVVGTMPRAWYRARELGKTWYPSLKELVDECIAKRSEEGEEIDETEEVEA